MWKPFNYFKSKLEAKDTQHIDLILKEEDPSEVRIAANEFLYLLMNKNITKTLYYMFDLYHGIIFYNITEKIINTLPAWISNLRFHKIVFKTFCDLSSFLRG